MIALKKNIFSGEKIRRELQFVKDRSSILKEKLEKAKENSPSNNGQVVIDDENRLNMLHKKSRILRQQYSSLGPHR